MRLKCWRVGWHFKEVLQLDLTLIWRAVPRKRSRRIQMRLAARTPPLMVWYSWSQFINRKLTIVVLAALHFCLTRVVCMLMQVLACCWLVLRFFRFILIHVALCRLIYVDVYWFYIDSWLLVLLIFAYLKAFRTNYLRLIFVGCPLATLGQLWKAFWFHLADVGYHFGSH